MYEETEPRSLRNFSNDRKESTLQNWFKFSFISKACIPEYYLKLPNVLMSKEMQSKNFGYMTTYWPNGKAERKKYKI